MKEATETDELFQITPGDLILNKRDFFPGCGHSICFLDLAPAPNPVLSQIESVPATATRAAIQFAVLKQIKEHRLRRNSRLSFKYLLMLS